MMKDFGVKFCPFCSGRVSSIDEASPNDIGQEGKFQCMNSSCFRSFNIELLTTPSRASAYNMSDQDDISALW
jgi:hypothetical protein